MAPLPDQPDASPPAASPSALPALPVYATAPPPAAVRHYQLQRAGQRARARLEWAPEGTRYRLSLMAEAEADSHTPGTGTTPAASPLHGLGAASLGQIDSLGLVPERFVDRRRGRDQRAANFSRERREVRGSGGGTPWPWPEGGQDRLSWLLQLAAVLQANPALAAPGSPVQLAVAGPQGPAAVWAFQVRGLETVQLPGGQAVPGLALQRLPQHPYDLQVDAWLDPADHHLPLRWRLSAPPGNWASEWLRLPAPAAGVP